jgi:hypothetical protein
MSWARSLLLLVVMLTGCSSISTVRVQPETVYVAPGLKPVAVIYARASSAYVLFVPLPGHVDLDRVVNRMLLATAKSLGADKVVNIRVDVTPDDGIWTVRKLLGWRTAEASGVAVMVEAPAAAPAPAPPAPVAPPASPASNPP